MRSVRNRRFHKAFDDLSGRVQDLARTAYRKFKANPFDPTLDFHEIQGTKTKNVYAVDTGTDRGTAYRALGVWDKDEDVIIWFWIGSHEAYNNVIKRL